MATRYNYTGQLITDGLVLNLDAAKRDSYPGSGTTWYDISGNGNNGTLTNGPTYTGVSKDAAIVFDGTNDYVDCGSNIATTSSITVNSWVNLDINNDYQHIVDSSTNTWHLAVLNNGRAYFYDGNEFHRSGSILPTGSWCMATGVKDESKNTIYVNGSPSDTVTSTNTIPTNTISIARWDGVSGTPSRYLNGNIAQTQIYNQALSQFEIFQNFNAMKGRYGIPDIVTDGLVLNLDAGNPYSYLSGSSGTTWTDVSGEGNDGTLTNGASYANGAIEFDGVDDYVNLGAPILQGSFSSFTFIFVFKLDSTSASNVLIDSRDASGDGVSFLVSQPSGVVLYSALNGANLAGTTTLSTGNIYHVVETYDGTTAKFFINSSEESSTNTTQNFNVTANTLIGARSFNTPGTALMNGNIYSTQIYNRALTQEEITQNFNALRGRYGI